MHGVDRVASDLAARDVAKLEMDSTDGHRPLDGSH